ncbi:hypothetical protein G6F66_014346 [Rhizopus arrhizus]|nr:hypothetical protein G6F66_014346 [Rhizopus arrhizus]
MGTPVHQLSQLLLVACALSVLHAECGRLDAVQRAVPGVHGDGAVVLLAGGERAAPTRASRRGGAARGKHHP